MEDHDRIKPPNQFPNECWSIANYTLRNKLKWNRSQNLKSTEEYIIENIVC